jgi:hypothetical protein
MLALMPDFIEVHLYEIPCLSRIVIFQLLSAQHLYGVMLSPSVVFNRGYMKSSHEVRALLMPFIEI